MTEPTTKIALFDSVCSQEEWARDGNHVVVALPGGRHQRISADVFADDGDQILRLRTAIGAAAVLNEARMAAALRMNLRFRCGAVAIDGDRVVLVDTLLLRATDADELRAAILYLARKADELERGLFSDDRH